jgi:asparagine synthase (glutamine-hydrolysing)
MICKKFSHCIPENSMCGLVAIFSPNRAVCEAALWNATEMLRRRGPDLRRCWIDSRGQVGLGHARLSIIDFETGAQPIACENESLRIVVSGEFYDFERIRDRLERRGHRFRTRSDSEIALHLYEDQGAECLKELRGEFAFVLWDKPNQTLFAARDRFGIKPLYYAVVGDTLYLASEVKALFAAGVPAEWDPESFYQQLFVYLNQDRTLFKGVFQVPPGHYLLATAEGIRVFRYWDLDYPQSADYRRDLNEGECVEQLRGNLTEAVRLRLRADIPVTVFLSGGVDSASILGFASSVCDAPLHAYTVSFSQTDYDESDVASETAAHTGAIYHTVPVRQTDLADHLADAVWHAETLAINLHGVARYILSRALRGDGYRVALTGEGSDEIFGGYIQSRQEMQLSIENNGQTGTPGAGSEPDSSLFGVHRALGFTPAWLQRVALTRSVFHLLLNADYQAQFTDLDPFALFIEQFDRKGQLEGRHPAIQSLYLWTRSILPNYTLFAERLEMAHGVEVRLPFLDHHLFENVRHIPPSLLLRDREKHVLREASRPVITETVYRRPKQPFLAPPALLSATGPIQEMARDLFRGSELSSLPFFDQAAVCAAFDHLPRMKSPQRHAFEAALLMVMCSCILKSRLLDVAENKPQLSIDRGGVTHAR